MNVLNRSITSLFIVAGALVATGDLTAAAPASSAADECTKELLLSYFPESIVTDTLKRFDVPQDKIAAINKALALKDKEIVKLVEEKAAKMNPNPLKDPQQRQAAVKLFRDTLFEAFSTTLKDNGVTDASKFQAMLDDIQQQKAKKFAMCMDKKKAEADKQDAEDSAEEDDSDEDDSSDDGDDEDDDSEDEDEEQSDSVGAEKTASKS